MDDLLYGELTDVESEYSSSNSDSDYEQKACFPSSSFNNQGVITNTFNILQILPIQLQHMTYTKYIRLTTS